MAIKIFLLNGPPSSGKDSLGNYVIANDFTIGKTKFAYPLKEANKAFYGLTDEQFEQIDNDPTLKETPLDILLGKTWREVCIGLSEDYIKKMHGNDAFGRLMVQRLLNLKSDDFTAVISDCGFDEEVVPLIEEFGRDSVFLFKIMREGKDFKKDSRNYIDGKKLKIDTYELHNRNSKSNTPDQKFLQDGFALVQSLKAGKIPLKKTNLLT